MWIPTACDEATRSEYAKAHSYTEPGLHVGCIEGRLCSDPGKHPLTAGGVKDATTDEATIRQWWAKWPDANIGGATGVKYDVLDCDRAVPERVSLAMPAAKGPLSLTGRRDGQHALFEAQPPMLRPPPKLSFGEWKTAGGYVVLPPSLHPSGQRYEWSPGHGPDLTLPALTKGFREALAKERFDPNRAARERAHADGRELLELVLDFLQAGGYPVEETGDDRWQARCPCHAPMSDPAPHGRTSLSMRLVPGGEHDRLLIFCRAGCRYHDIVAALGIPREALWARYDRESYLRSMPDERVALGGILDDLVARFGRYLFVPDLAFLHSLVLWVAHAWVVGAFDVTPRLHLRSATMRSGKTRIFELIEPLCPNAFTDVSVTAPTIFRTLQLGAATFLLDEADRWLGKGGDESGAGMLTAVLNAGYKRGATVARTVRTADGDWEIVHFPVFAAVAFAGITTRNIPGPLLDRSIELLMRRRGTRDEIERFRQRAYAVEVRDLRDRLEAWALRQQEADKEEAEKDRERVEALYATWDPTHDVPVPAGEDRAQDIWEPLKVLALHAGGEWPQRCDAAAALLFGEARRWGWDDDDDNPGLRLIRDMLSVFAAKDDPDTLPVGEVRNALNNEPDWPWAEWRAGGRAITDATVAALLRPFKLKSTRPRLTPDDAGYDPTRRTRYGERFWVRSELEAVAAVYVSGLSRPATKSRTTRTTRTDPQVTAPSRVVRVWPVVRPDPDHRPTEPRTTTRTRPGWSDRTRTTRQTRTTRDGPLTRPVARVVPVVRVSARQDGTPREAHSPTGS